MRTRVTSCQVMSEIIHVSDQVIEIRLRFPIPLLCFLLGTSNPWSAHSLSPFPRTVENTSYFCSHFSHSCSARLSCLSVCSAETSTRRNLRVIISTECPTSPGDATHLSLTSLNLAATSSSSFSS